VKWEQVCLFDSGFSRFALDTFQEGQNSVSDFPVALSEKRLCQFRE
jgi:hypothetical protein